MPGRSDLFSANDLLLIDHVTPKRKKKRKVDGMRALELSFHVSPHFVAALIIWYHENIAALE